MPVTEEVDFGERHNLKRQIDHHPITGYSNATPSGSCSANCVGRILVGRRLRVVPFNAALLSFSYSHQ
jgi:hypothetical protein